MASCCPCGFSLEPAKKKGSSMVMFLLASPESQETNKGQPQKP